MSGFGYNGYDERGAARWDLISNVDAWGVEVSRLLAICNSFCSCRLQTALSFKVTLDNWNITTMLWLRRVSFDRVPKNMRTFATYLLSAMWHGFFVGYYITFLTGALATVSARNVSILERIFFAKRCCVRLQMRRCVRHRFQSSWLLARFYDVLTFFATKIALAWTVYPFVTMHTYPGLYVYKLATVSKDLFSSSPLADNGYLRRILLRCLAPSLCR